MSWEKKDCSCNIKQNRFFNGDMPDMQQVETVQIQRDLGRSVPTVLAIACDGIHQQAKSGKNHTLIVLLCDNLSTIYKIKYCEMGSFPFSIKTTCTPKLTDCTYVHQNEYSHLSFIIHKLICCVYIYTYEYFIYIFLH